MKRLGLSESNLFTIEEKPAECTDYVNDNVFAIDFDEKTVRVARMLNSIAGDGNTNVLHLNTLDYDKWDEKVKDEDWLNRYFEGWSRLKKLRLNKNSNRDFLFDIVMANPPFAGDISEGRILAKYEISKNVSYKKLKSLPNGVNAIKVNEVNPSFADALQHGEGAVFETSDGVYKKVQMKNSLKMSRDVLFIERNLDFLKPGGRMAIVLPQGHFNNASDKYIRDYIAGRCRILAVIGLHTNVFKPHTPTKTSVLIVQKWDDLLCPKKDDYNIFFATMQEPSKDNRGEKRYRYTINEDGLRVPLLDSHGHLVVEHDLYNHEGLTQDGIAEAFIEFAKKECLSFFAEAPLIK